MADMTRMNLTAAAALMLSGCATTPAPQTAAFDKISQGDRDAFRSAVDAHRAATRAFATNALVEGEGTLTYVGCDHTKPKDICTNIFSLQGVDISTAEVAPEASKLISAVAQYGAAMKELGSAKDLAALNSKIDGTFTAIAALAAATGIGAVAAPAIALVGQTTKGSYKLKRIAQMRAFAKAADPAVQKAALILSKDSMAIKSGILAAVSKRLTGAQLEIPQAVDEIAAIKVRLAMPNRSAEAIAADEQRLSTLRQRVRYLVDDQFEAAAQLQGSRALKGDFSALGDAHTKVLASLENPMIDPDVSLEYANAYISGLKDLKAAL
ncbi:hypothetical protein E5673_14265 [Sphingomonas sp. PAMC26645]|uniref:hypothetical protein n=1 Tax=Sphingomonas sp. PAMC26645 TaxID=2565555 RepID=UPI00109DE5E0|nr:hypothetical protein [Sphingomonas sp. PAMC26645]QCB43245.1 hypothetical protein E5673_14265 [Sphingomonas sp. PAMC26645]